MSSRLPVVPVPGLRPVSLGYYLASLGLIRALARAGWPSVRAAWKDDALQLVGGPTDLEEMLEAICGLAAKRAWMPYRRGWIDAQKAGTKKKSAKPLALWQSCTEEQDLELFAAHAVPAATVSFNPLLGKGGSSGNRDFSDGWARAVQALDADERLPELARKRAELKALLLGEVVTWMPEHFNAASWFSHANKIFNSGQGPYRDGSVSPWLMVMACEGLPFFAGGASRRLGARARRLGAFPFVASASAPRVAQEAGHDAAEVWAPIWERPMTLSEIATLFSRGRAELGGRGVLTPSAFAAAVMHRGVDAGITGFRRFVLGRTTSSNTFEPRFEGAIQVKTAPRTSGAVSAAFERLLGLVERLPKDRKEGKGWRFEGLRGGMEAAMVRAAGAPSDPEAACDLLDAAVGVLDRVDRNRRFREQRIGWEPLPLEWLSTLFRDEPPGLEARLALALVSSFPAGRPFALYRFGVKLERGRRFVHPPQIPKEWVWRGGGPLSRLLSEVLNRRTLDGVRDEPEPVRNILPAGGMDVERWLSGFVDDGLLARWISSFALFDWRKVPGTVRGLALHNGEARGVSGALCLFGLLHPLFDLLPLWHPRSRAEDLLPLDGGARTPAAARRLLGYLRAGDMSGAVQFAASRYAMAGTVIIRNDVPWRSEDVERLTASMLFTTFCNNRSALAGRWLRPRREQGG